MDPATLTMAMSASGTILGAAGELGEAEALRAQGKYAHQSAAFQAQQLDRKALEAEAIGQRAAHEERKQAEVVKSRALSLAAASGADAADVTVEKIVGDIMEEGEYRANIALYESRTAASDMRLQAEALRRGGFATEALYKAASRSKRMGAAAGILSSGAGIMGKYSSGGGATFGSVPYEWQGSYHGDWGYSWT